MNLLSFLNYIALTSADREIKLITRLGVVYEIEGVRINKDNTVYIEIGTREMTK